MMKEKKKIQQPFRNPGEYTAYLEGVKAAADALGWKVDALAWGGGIPKDLTLYIPGEKPDPVVTADITPEIAETIEGADAETAAGTE